MKNTPKLLIFISFLHLAPAFFETFLQLFQNDFAITKIGILSFNSDLIIIPLMGILILVSKNWSFLGFLMLNFFIVSNLSNKSLGIESNWWNYYLMTLLFINISTVLYLFIPFFKKIIPVFKHSNIKKNKLKIPLTNLCSLYTDGPNNLYDCDICAISEMDAIIQTRPGILLGPNAQVNFSYYEHYISLKASLYKDQFSKNSNQYFLRFNFSSIIDFIKMRLFIFSVRRNLDKFTPSKNNSASELAS